MKGFSKCKLVSVTNRKIMQVSKRMEDDSKKLRELVKLYNTNLSSKPKIKIFNKIRRIITKYPIIMEVYKQDMEKHKTINDFDDNSLYPSCMISCRYIHVPDYYIGLTVTNKTVSDFIERWKI